MFDFEKLEIYKKAREFRKELKKYFPKIRDRYLRDQIQRASLSIILNLTEGAAKYSYKEKVHYYRIARGSAFECVPILQELFDDEVFIKEQYNNLYSLLEEIGKMLSGLINSSRKNLG